MGASRGREARREREFTRAARGVIGFRAGERLGSTMEMKKRIYCLEGVHDWGGGKVEPTVEPMLELLQRLGYWEDYLHRTCGTMSELDYRLNTEWNGWCEKGLVLYFCTHGARDQIWLRSDDQPVGLLTLKEWIDADGCHIHFGGCDTFSGGEDNLKDLMDYTGATSVSGYATDTDWLGRNAPALALELLFFALLKEVNIGRNSRTRPGQLRKIHKDIDDRFTDCKFNMLVRRYRKP